MINKNLKYNKGYTLLFAVLVSSLVLSVGISILNIGKKEFLLSSSARDSLIAFYAADSGLQCAKHYDQLGIFVASTFTPGMLVCNTKMQEEAVFAEVSAAGDIFSFDLNINDSSCAYVTITKGSSITTIESRGYNIGWNVPYCSSPSPRRVERAIRYIYQSSP